MSFNFGKKYQNLISIYLKNGFHIALTYVDLSYITFQS